MTRAIRPALSGSAVGANTPIPAAATRGPPAAAGGGGGAAGGARPPARGGGVHVAIAAWGAERAGGQRVQLDRHARTLGGRRGDAAGDPVGRCEPGTGGVGDRKGPP